MFFDETLFGHNKLILTITPTDNVFRTIRITYITNGYQTLLSYMDYFSLYHTKY